MANISADGLILHYLDAEDIAALTPARNPPRRGDEKLQLQERLEAAGVWTPRQIAARRWSIGCVSLEVTQRCNLDCTLCYLSESSEAVLDVPLEEVYRRIDDIAAHFGADTDVQISGGDPTLRRTEDLVSIVRRTRERGLRPSLFTNGILASRALLEALVDAGLVDVAFHVDLTQQRKGYDSEQALNALRVKYIERARGLPLAVMFNTTVFDGNFDEIPMLVRFFASHADVVRLASFQLQADTGRGILRERPTRITMASVTTAIQQGANCRLAFDTFDVGHPECNRYAYGFVVNRTFHDFLDDPAFVVPLMRATSKVRFDRTNRTRALGSAALAFLRVPWLWPRGLLWLGRTLWRARRDLFAARGRIDKLSFVVHNFMGACALERARIDSCVFMVETGEGPLSMCVHNARRDDFILKPFPLPGADDGAAWDPLAGRTAGVVSRSRDTWTFPLKKLRGRRKEQQPR